MGCENFSRIHTFHLTPFHIARSAKYYYLESRKTLVGGTRIGTGDLTICSRMPYHWAIRPLIPLEKTCLNSAITLFARCCRKGHTICLFAQSSNFYFSDFLSISLFLIYHGSQNGELFILCYSKCETVIGIFRTICMLFFAKDRSSSQNTNVNDINRLTDFIFSKVGLAACQNGSLHFYYFQLLAILILTLHILKFDYIYEKCKC